MGDSGTTVALSHPLHYEKRTERIIECCVRKSGSETLSDEDLRRVLAALPAGFGL